jgi:hypothetical protein
LENEKDACIRDRFTFYNKGPTYLHSMFSNTMKYDFYQRKIQYLGHVISEGGIAVDSEKIKSIME